MKTNITNTARRITTHKRVLTAAFAVVALGSSACEQNSKGVTTVSVSGPGASASASRSPAAKGSGPGDYSITIISRPYTNCTVLYPEDYQVAGASPSATLSLSVPISTAIGNLVLGATNVNLTELVPGEVPSFSITCGSDIVQM